MNEEFERRITELEQKYELLRQDLIMTMQELPKEIQEKLSWKLIDRWVKADLDPAKGPLHFGEKK